MVLGHVALLMSLAMAVLCIREWDLKPRTSLLPALCLASTGSRAELKIGRKKGRRMKIIVYQYRYFPQINSFPGISVGQASSKCAKNPERAFINSREVGGNPVPQNKTSRLKQAAIYSFCFGLI